MVPGRCLFAAGCGWSKGRTRPWSVVAVAEKSERIVLSASGSPGWPGSACGCGTRGLPAVVPGQSNRTFGVTCLAVTGEHMLASLGYGFREKAVPGLVT